MRAARLALGALAAGLLIPAAAAGHVETRTVGQVTATLSWKGNFAETRNFRIAIDRAGARVLDTAVKARACGEETPGFPCPWPSRSRPLALRDLDGDGEPEAVVTGFTGGAHCCVVGIVYRFDGSTYVQSEHNFLDTGFRLRDLERDGVVEFQSADARFAYLYGSFAESVFPVQVIGFEAGGFGDVTTQFPDLVRKDLGRTKRAYKRRARSERQLGLRPALAAYVADLHLLDRKQTANRVLHRALERGELEPTRFSIGPDGRKFIRHLKRTLRRFGYR